MTDIVAEKSRRVDWLELFFDLVFVVIVEQLTDLLHGDPDGRDFATVALLFAVVWIAWLNVTSLVNVAEGRERLRQLLILVSMAGVALIAVAIPDALGTATPLFVVGFAVARLAIWPLWVGVNWNRSGSRIRALIGPAIALVWLVTIAVPEAARPWVWLALIVVELVFSATGFASTQFDAGHLRERVGLFVMIVLGESVVELILAVHPGQSWLAWAISAGAFVFVCAIWWSHYQADVPLAEQVLSRGSRTALRDVIVIAHFFTVLGLIGIAAGLGSAIEHADDSHMPYGAVVALGAGIGAYHLGDVIVSWRYAVQRGALLVLALPGVVAAALIIVMSALPAWTLLVVALAYVAGHALLSARAALRMSLPQDAP